ncbi:GTP-binding protein Rheb -like protein [Halotydeus destructor]|nr:GTP-binding protein Rheb -like protein [Halotydeus destructor]
MPAKQRKIAIMGYRSVGKSSLAIQFVQGQFVDLYDPTIESILTKTVKIRGQDYYLQLVDTAGQDEYSIFPAQYTMDIHGYCLVYSINSQKSFEVVKVIHEKLMDLTGSTTLPILLVGNKTDLANERVVSTEEGKKLAAQMNAHFVEVSAKQHSAVTELFNNLILSIERRSDDGSSTDRPSNKCTVS